MSMHKNPLTYMEKRGLHAHGLPTDEPSQLSDAFRAGVAWAGHEVQSLKNELEAKVRQNVQLMRERDAYRTAEEHQIALRQKIEHERDALAALFVRLQDGATDLIHASSEEEAGDAMELIAECCEKEARSILARVIAESRIEGALAVRHLTQGDDWEDTELRAVIDDYVAGLRRQAEDPQ